MIEIVKDNIKNLLREKQVSLAMIFDRRGDILWHYGREVRGRNVEDGEGFCKSFIQKTLTEVSSGGKGGGMIDSCRDSLSSSALFFPIKSVLIEPIDDFYFLYLDSGVKGSYSKSELRVFTTLFSLLKDIVSRIRHHQSDIGGMTGKSKAMERVRELVLKYSVEEEVLLLTGETGVGKNHVAELIHRYSGRTGKLVVAHMPTIPRTLFESEIFGHRRGAFTDARSDKKGMVSEAEGGTLLLDEISEVPLSFQAKLLRFIDTRKYKILGESFERQADIRILAATNKDLPRAIERLEFREDLYYRLGVLEIEIPPLRLRKEDIKPLVLANLGYLKGKEIGEDFWPEVLVYSWPGNVRELFTVLKRAGILLESPITGKDIRGIIYGRGGRVPFEAIGDDVERVDEVWNRLQAGESFWDVVKMPFMRRVLNMGQVKALIRLAQREAGGGYKKILALLNIEPKDYKRFLNFINDYRLNK